MRVASAYPSSMRTHTCAQHTRTHTCVSAFSYARAHTRIRTYVRIRAYARMCIRECAHARMCTYAHTHVCVSAFSYARAHTHVCVLILPGHTYVCAFSKWREKKNSTSDQRGDVSHCKTDIARFHEGRDLSTVDSQNAISCSSSMSFFVLKYLTGNVRFCFFKISNEVQAISCSSSSLPVRYFFKKNTSCWLQVWGHICTVVSMYMHTSLLLTKPLCC